MSEADLPIVDAHQHFWDLDQNYHPWLCDPDPIPFRYGDYADLKRNYLPGDLLRDAARQRLEKTVHMEAEWDPRDPVGETRWVHEVAERTGWPHAVLGQAWFARDDIAEVLAGHTDFPLSRGVREKPAAAASPTTVVRGAPRSMGDPQWRAGYALLARNGLHYELQTPWWHLAEAAELAADFPDTPIVLNHTGLPSERSAAGLAGWREAMETLAAQPNAFCKISGLGQPGRPWSVADNGPVVLETIRIFGTGRCMFASNFPVDGLVADYDTIWNGFKTITADLPLDARRALFHDNAARLYRL